MKRHFYLLVFWLLAGPAWAGEWTEVSHGLPETDIVAVAADSGDATVFYAASSSRLYRTSDAGVSWKEVFDAQGPKNQIHRIHVSPDRSVYACTADGIWTSKNGGQKWELFFKSLGGASKDIYCIAAAGDGFWIGAGDGLYHYDAVKKRFRKNESFLGGAAYSVLLAKEADIFVLSSKGIYKSTDQGLHWQRVSVRFAAEAEIRDDSLQQFGIEESVLPSFGGNLAFVPSQKRLFAVSEKGILESSEGSDWKIAGLSPGKVRWLLGTDHGLYAATETGVYASDASGSFREVYAGLPTKEVRMLSYSPSDGSILAATKKGVFRLSDIERVSMRLDPDSPAPVPREILRRFAAEPTIRQVQDAAIRYAEVHPEKIEAWRRAARVKALLPTLSIRNDLNTDLNVDIDRGGTNDADKFIVGPEEKSVDWSVSISWNLADLIWNGDQTSIDSRSKLMVELRDDVLAEVTHLYYERRRAQAAMFFKKPQDSSEEFEQALRLEELTAGIDALTGGYFSARLEKHESNLQRPLY